MPHQAPANGRTRGQAIQGRQTQGGEAGEEKLVILHRLLVASLGRMTLSPLTRKSAGRRRRWWKRSGRLSPPAPSFNRFDNRE